MVGWRKKMKEPVINRRSTKNGEDLTGDEQAWIEFHMGTGYVFCPDCQKGRLLSGPEGGCCVNALCPQCGSEFNLTIIVNRGHSILFTPERISDPGPRSFADRAFIYKDPIECYPVEEERPKFKNLWMLVVGLILMSIGVLGATLYYYNVICQKI
jgi:hypothetical protein